MRTLANFNVGDVIVEVYGPVDGRNYNMAGRAVPLAPRIEVEVIGSGTVHVEETQTSKTSNRGYLNNVVTDRIGDPASYVALGLPVSSASGKVILTPTVGTVTQFSSLRVILDVAGNGQVVFKNLWN